METPQHTKENNYFRTKAENTIQNTNFAYLKEEEKKRKKGERERERERERAKKKRKRWEYIKGQSLATKLVVT